MITKIKKLFFHLFIEVPGVDDGPVGHGEGVARALGHLHPPARHPGPFKMILCKSIANIINTDLYNRNQITLHNQHKLTSSDNPFILIYIYIKDD